MSDILSLVALPLIIAVASFVMVIKGNIPIRILGAVIIAIGTAFFSYDIGSAMAIHQDNGYFNTNIGWPCDRLFQRLRQMADSNQYDALRNALRRLDEEARVFPMDNRNEAPFRLLVDNILADTTNSPTAGTER